MRQSGASYCRVLAVLAGMTLLSADGVAGASVEAPEQRPNARLARTASAAWCWARMYGAWCGSSPRHVRKARNKSDPRPMLIIGIGF